MNIERYRNTLISAAVAASAGVKVVKHRRTDGESSALIGSLGSLRLAVRDHLLSLLVPKAASKALGYVARGKRRRCR